jgi:hypothetical protein
MHSNTCCNVQRLCSDSTPAYLEHSLQLPRPPLTLLQPTGAALCRSPGGLDGAVTRCRPPTLGLNRHSAAQCSAMQHWSGRLQRPALQHLDPLALHRQSNVDLHLDVSPVCRIESILAGRSLSLQWWRLKSTRCWLPYLPPMFPLPRPLAPWQPGWKWWGRARGPARRQEAPPQSAGALLLVQKLLLGSCACTAPAARAGRGAGGWSRTPLAPPQARATHP